MKKGLFLILIPMIVLLIAVSLIIETKPLITKAETEIPPVIINELAWAGSSSDWRDEWIELKNTTGEDINLTGWQITKDTSGDDDSNEVLMLEIIIDLDNPQNTIIPAGEYFLIAHNAHNYEFSNGKLSVLNIEPDYIDSSITLSNSNLLIKLYDGLWNEEGELIDITGNGSSPEDYAGSNSAKTSMERNENYGPGDIPESWHEANEAINLDEGVFDKATPKAPNSFKLLDIPIISSVTPNIAEIDTIFEIEEINGENFVIEGNTQIQIHKNSNIISATEVHVASSTIIDSAQLNLNGAEVGNWDLVVINPDTQEAILPNAINLTEPEEEIIYSNNIIISELYPKPDTSSNDEFIELHNIGSSSVNLKGWKLDDKHPGGSAEYTIADDLIIGPDQYLAFLKPQTHISLNDTGDYARLIQPDNNILDETSNYGSAERGCSYSLIDQQWKWSLRVTQASQNIFESPTDDYDDSETPDASEIELQLDFDNIQTNTVMLLWDINMYDIATNVSIYQSDEEENLGTLIDSALLNEKAYLISNLQPNTNYFFTLAINYQGELVKSNQIEITTLEEILNNIGYTKQIIITEILPNPAAGQDEFIELYNPTEEMVNIAGWRLVDASSRSYTINSLDLPPIIIATLQTGSVIIGPGQYALLEQSVTNLHLNNSGGEELYLLDTDDNIIDSVTYTKSAKRNYVYVLAPNNHWFWSDEMTPGEANDISFAGITGDTTDYLTASGVRYKLGWMSLISLVLSGIIFFLMKRYGYTSHK